MKQFLEVMREYRTSPKELKAVLIWDKDKWFTSYFFSKNFIEKTYKEMEVIHG